MSKQIKMQPKPMGKGAAMLSFHLSAPVMRIKWGLRRKNTMSVLSNLKVKIPDKKRALIQGGERDFTSLPELLRFADGREVLSAQDFAERRKEILALFESEVYGAMPKSGFETSFKTVEEGDAFSGKAIRRQIEITVSTKKGSSSSLLLIYIPKSNNPVPAVVGLNFTGNHTVCTDEAVIKSPACEKDLARGFSANRWDIEKAIDQGCAVATLFCNDFAPDDNEKWNSRVISVFDEPDFKTVGAWAFGLIRAADYLCTAKEIDSSKLACIGHSRLGKAALWAGANDERFALVISNDSGCSGSSLARKCSGETVRSITGFFPNWFGKRYASYGKKVDKMPVDQHMLLACVAPRKLYVACAYDDLWSDPRGSQYALEFAKPAFRICGCEVTPEIVGEAKEGTVQHCSGMGYHLRSGWHDVTSEDWDNYLNYIGKYL